jgi:hypothetical protein
VVRRAITTPLEQNRRKSLRDSLYFGEPVTFGFGGRQVDDQFTLLHFTGATLTS